jgi:nodulation protein E
MPAYVLQKGCKRMPGSRRVVVTGTGAVTPIGNDVPSFWLALKEGRSGVGPLRDIDFDARYVRDLFIQIACQVKDFDPKTRIRNRLLLLADRYSQFAGAAAAEAFAQSKLEIPLKDGYRSACIIGSGAGGLNTIEWAYNQFFTKNRRGNDPLMLLKFIGSSAAAHVGIDYGIKGPTFGTVSACATATHAIGLMLRFIREGLVDIGIAGASEAAINYGSMKAWQAIRVLSPDGCFPFSKKRNGTVLGEGAGVLVLEELEHAKARGAKILAELKGFGMASDAKDMINPDLEGPKEAMRQALEDAHIAPSEVDYLNAHGTATALNDINETRAIKEVFGNAANKLAISSTKSMHGHLLGASGGVEAVACVKAIEENFAPATIGLSDPDPNCDLDYVPNVGRAIKVNHAMSNSFAFGGLNAVLVFGRAPV